MNIKRYQVEGRIKVEFHFSETVFSSNKKSAREKVIDKICKHHKIAESNLLSDKMSCKEIEVE